MTNEEAISILKKAIDNISKALDRVIEEIPQYLRREMLHPKKKPRGSIRRKKRESESE